MPNWEIREGLPPGQRRRAAELYWHAFSGKLGRILGPDRKAICFLELVINPSRCIVATSTDGEILGIAGYKSDGYGFVGGNFRQLRQVYGLLGALWRGDLLNTLDRDEEPGSLLMDGICVDAGARGLGIGTALLNAISQKAVDLGQPAVSLDVIDSNPKARALYERSGFRAVGETQTGLMRKVLGFRYATRMRLDVVPPNAALQRID